MTYILVFRAVSNSNDYYFTLELKLIFNLLNKQKCNYVTTNVLNWNSISR